MCGLEFERNETAKGWESAGQPNGTVSAEGPDFENTSGSLNASEQMKKLALVGSDVDGGKAGVRVCVNRFVERLIGMDERVCEVTVYGGPEILIHMVMRIREGGCRSKLSEEPGVAVWNVCLTALPIA